MHNIVKDEIVSNSVRGQSCQNLLEGRIAFRVGHSPVLLLRIPNQPLFALKAPARYLGMHEQTLRKLVDRVSFLPAVSALGASSRSRIWTVSSRTYPGGVMAAAKNPEMERRSHTGIDRVKDHRGRTRIQVSERWPDGSGFRHYFPNATVAKNTLTRIEAAIVQGVWQELKEELLHADRLGEISVPTLVTVGRFDSVILSCSETLHRGLAGAQMEIFEASAHLVPLEESERYLDVVRKFLRQTERHDL